MLLPTAVHVYAVRPRKDKRGVDLISDALPFGRLWYGEPDAIRDAVDNDCRFPRSPPDRPRIVLIAWAARSSQIALAIRTPGFYNDAVAVDESTRSQLATSEMKVRKFNSIWL